METARFSPEPASAVNVTRYIRSWKTYETYKYVRWSIVVIWKADCFVAVKCICYTSIVSLHVGHYLPHMRRRCPFVIFINVAERSRCYYTGTGSVLEGTLTCLLQTESEYSCFVCERSARTKWDVIAHCNGKDEAKFKRKAYPKCVKRRSPVVPICTTYFNKF